MSNRFWRGCDSGPVHNTLGQALAAKWAIIRRSAVAGAWVFWGRRGEYLSIVATDDGDHVAQTAVAGFYIVSVEQLVVSVMVWEMLIHKF